MYRPVDCWENLSNSFTIAFSILSLTYDVIIHRLRLSDTYNRPRIVGNKIVTIAQWDILSQNFHTLYQSTMILKPSYLFCFWYYFPDRPNPPHKWKKNYVFILCFRASWSFSKKEKKIEDFRPGGQTPPLLRTCPHFFCCDPAPKIDISIFGPEIETNLAVFLNIAKIFDSIFNLQFTIEIGSRQTLVLLIPSS